MIELNSLRYFVSAYEVRTFSKAARENGVSQPTVSAAIQKLEDRLGASLFLRSKTGLTPTPLGTRLYHDALNSVTHLTTLESRILNQPKQNVRIHCAPDMLINSLASGLSSLRREFSDLAFGFTAEAKDSDITYTTDVCLPASHSFILLEEETFGVAFSSKHPLATLSEVRLEDVRRYPIIHRPYCPNADHMDMNALSTAPAAQAMNDPQLMDLVAADLGIAFTPRSHARYREDVVWVPLADRNAGTRKAGISHRRSALATKLAKKLAEVIKSG
ncbi:LysR family transcriptional regulator [Roseibium sp. RKSG952]|uniref:LysR family transcriptional regulator n=1 Tax=Roseibium sp. RKSG952 TaxID=2529384 RepID=UPI0012BBF781|nr:LysR family transcriptional regulator [Roseibium sp. RKSG952]MTI01993.1 LysR family transcriptional regulator [Roseibium sp. RKSG952]